MLVVKVGGSQGIDYESFIEDLAEYHNWVLLHGGSHELNVISEKLGHPPQFVESVSGYISRYTDRKTLEMINMIYPGKMSKMIVELLQSKGVNAVGLSGLDGRILECKRKSTLQVKKKGKRMVLRGEHSGIVKRVNTELLQMMLDHGYKPVLTIPAVSFAGTAVNVDGDRAAAKVARALKAEKLVILSNVPGFLRDVEDPASVIKNIPSNQLAKYVEKYAKGRMKKKLMGAKEALEGQVRKVILGDATQDKPLTKALSGEGTVIE